MAGPPQTRRSRKGLWRQGIWTGGQGPSHKVCYFFRGFWVKPALTFVLPRLSTCNSGSGPYSWTPASFRMPLPEFLGTVVQRLQKQSGLEEGHSVAVNKGAGPHQGGREAHMGYGSTGPGGQEEMGRRLFSLVLHIYMWFKSF